MNTKTIVGSVVGVVALTGAFIAGGATTGSLQAANPLVQKVSSTEFQIANPDKTTIANLKAILAELNDQRGLKTEFCSNVLNSIDEQITTTQKNIDAAVNLGVVEEIKQ